LCFCPFSNSPCQVDAPVVLPHRVPACLPSIISYISPTLSSTSPAISIAHSYQQSLLSSDTSFADLVQLLQTGFVLVSFTVHYQYSSASSALIRQSFLTLLSDHKQLVDSQVPFILFLSRLLQLTPAGILGPAADRFYGFYLIAVCDQVGKESAAASKHHGVFESFAGAEVVHSSGAGADCAGPCKSWRADTDSDSLPSSSPRLSRSPELGTRHRFHPRLLLALQCVSFHVSGAGFASNNTSGTSQGSLKIYLRKLATRDIQ
jgi:hypothetical protein